MTTEMTCAVYGVELSSSESQEVFEWLNSKNGATELLLSLDIDQDDSDVSDVNFNEGYSHAFGVLMGESSYADTMKLSKTPPAKFAKRFKSDCAAALAAVGVTRRPKGILVSQKRKD